MSTESRMPPWETEMRTDFARIEQLRTVNFAENDYDYVQRIAQSAEIAEKWDSGSHAEDWAYLEDWSAHPDEARRALDEIEQDNARGHYPLTDVEYRSLNQVRDLYQHEHLARQQIHATGSADRQPSEADKLVDTCSGGWIAMRDADRRQVKGLGMQQ